MSIKNFLKVLVFLLISSTAMGMPKIYGKLNLSIDYDGGNGASTNSDLISNASRVGMKGDFEINDKLTGIYQLEYQVDVANNSSSTFKTRNSFLGITGNFGTIRVGTYDTPLKRAGLKADLFNDLRGDIKNITAGENRNSSFLGYESPELLFPLLDFEHTEWGWFKMETLESFPELLDEKLRQLLIKYHKSWEK